jgi:hypothetical protein
MSQHSYAGEDIITIIGLVNIGVQKSPNSMFRLPFLFQASTPSCTPDPLSK